MTPSPDPKTYTVCVAYYDTDCRATMTVGATSYAEACAVAVQRVDDGEVTTQVTGFGESPTFVYGVVEGDGDPFEGMANVPHRYQEPTGRADLSPEAEATIAAARAVVAASRRWVLPEPVSEAMTTLEAALKALPGTAR